MVLPQRASGVLSRSSDDLGHIKNFLLLQCSCQSGQLSTYKMSALASCIQCGPAALIFCPFSCSPCRRVITRLSHWLLSRNLWSKLWPSSSSRVWGRFAVLSWDEHTEALFLNLKAKNVTCACVCSLFALFAMSLNIDFTIGCYEYFRTESGLTAHFV